MSISKTVQPRDQISANLSCPFLLIISGAIQQPVPMKEFKYELLIIFALPKSLNFILPSVSTKMLAPLRSLWTIFWACKYSNPSRIYQVNLETTFSLSLSCLYYLSRSIIDPSDMYSKYNLNENFVFLYP